MKKVIVVNDVNIGGGGAGEVFIMHVNLINHNYNEIKEIFSPNLYLNKIDILYN